MRDVVTTAIATIAAALMVTGCSSSSSEQPQPAQDAGAEAAPATDKTTGLLCKSDADCDITGNKIARCSSGTYVVGPLDPTAVCIQAATNDVCNASDTTSIHFCDSNLGLCVKHAPSAATCEAMCIMDSDGTFTQKCAGSNGCNVESYGIDTTTNKINVFGICQGGCKADSDCPTGSKCDPVQRFCARSCTADTDCTKAWSAAPANWKCDTTRGACTFVYPKKLGDKCTSSDDCLCLSGSASEGVCIDLCRVGDDCGAGFECGFPLPEKDDKGMTLFSLTKQPSDLVGYCMKTCTADTDCSAVSTTLSCQTVPGMASKVCLVKPTGDAG